MATATAKKTKLVPLEGEEIWELQIPGTVYLRTVAHNEFGQPMWTDRVLGPNKKGLQFRITTVDRIANQNKVADDTNDPFKNGILVRCDVDQQLDVATASPGAITATDLAGMFGQHGVVFEDSLEPLSEINLRRLLDLAQDLDASHSQVLKIEETIQRRFAKGWAQDLEKPVPLS